MATPSDLLITEGRAKAMGIMGQAPAHTPMMALPQPPHQQPLSMMDRIYRRMRNVEESSEVPYEETFGNVEEESHAQDCMCRRSLAEQLAHQHVQLSLPPLQMDPPSARMFGPTETGPPGLTSTGSSASSHGAEVLAAPVGTDHQRSEALKLAHRQETQEQASIAKQAKEAKEAMEANVAEEEKQAKEETVAETSQEEPLID